MSYTCSNGTIKLELLGWSGAVFIGSGGCEWKEIKGLERSRSAT